MIKRKRVSSSKVYFVTNQQHGYHSIAIELTNGSPRKSVLSEEENAGKAHRPFQPLARLCHVCLYSLGHVQL